MHKIAAYAALAMAGGLLSLQIVGGLEATEGGSLYTRASMVAAMVTLAALPVFIEAARRVGAYGAAVALSVAFLAFLAYSLPATVGRTGEIKQAKVAEASAVARTRDDLERVTKTLVWAQQDMISDCGTGEGKRCRAKRNTVEALEARKAKLSSELVTGEVRAPGDLGAETWAWASFGTVSAETIRRASVLAFAVGLDVIIWALIWFATRVFAVQTVAETVSARRELEVPADVTADDLEALRRLLRKADAPLTNQEVADALGVVKGTASKLVSAGVHAGLVRREKVGREVAISLH